MQKNKIAVIGLGYVGLPVALRCAEKGYSIIGIDLDEKKIKKIRAGRSPFLENFIEERKKLLKKISVYSHFKKIKEADIIIICVPTPVDKNFYPILDPIKQAIENIIKNRKKGQLIIIESTINPGVCEEVVLPIFQEKKLKPGKDFFLAHCPERINPGDKRWDVSNIPRVLGALTSQGLKKAKKFYESILDGEIKTMNSIREAEAVKIVENSFRDINIAFVNELAQSFEQMDIDIKDVIEGAATKPFAFMPHFPSCGVGGHCIPVDPYYLIERAKKNGFDHKFLRVARAINNYMPIYSVNLLQDLLNKLKIPLKDFPVGVMGLSYKANVDDVRESPALKIIEELKKHHARVRTFDPYLPSLSTEKTWKQFLKKSKALIVTVNHKEFLELPAEEFKKNGIVAIVDGKNCLNKNKIKKLKIEYRGIGR